MRALTDTAFLTFLAYRSRPWNKSLDSNYQNLLKALLARKVFNYQSGSENCLVSLAELIRKINGFKKKLEANFLAKNPASSLSSGSLKAVIYAENTLDFCIAFFAAINLGFSVVLPQNLLRFRSLQEQSALEKNITTLFVLDQASKQSLKNIAPDVLVVDFVDIPILSKEIEINEDEFAVSNLASIYKNQTVAFYTSGSSGEPKLITKLISSLLAEVDALNFLWSSVLDDSKLVSTVSHQHAYGFLFRFLWPFLSLKAEIKAEDVFSQEELLQAKDSECCNRSTVLISSPGFLKRIDDLPTEQRASMNPLPEQVLKSLMAIFSSSSLLVQEVSDLVLQVFKVRPIEVLGSTETGGIAYRQQSEENQIWTCLPGVEIKLAGEEQRLMVKSNYLAEPQLKSQLEAFYLESGDLASLSVHPQAQILVSSPVNQGFQQFTLLGRVDEIVKIEGKRVSLREIERYLKVHEFVSDCKVIAYQSFGLSSSSHQKQSKHSRDTIGALIELNSKGKAFLQSSTSNTSLHTLVKSFKIFLKGVLDPVSIPRKWRFAEINDKTTYQSLVELFNSTERIDEN